MESRSQATDWVHALQCITGTCRIERDAAPYASLARMKQGSDALLFQPQPFLQRDKSRVRADVVEHRIDLDVERLRLTQTGGFLQPGERVVAVVDGGVAERNLIGRG